MAGGGIDGTGIMSAGVVSAFGSIVVNGREFDTSEAAIVINEEEVGVGDDAVRENLEIGMVVTVEGRISRDGVTATADRVVYSDSVIGPVESVGPDKRARLVRAASHLLMTRPEWSELPLRFDVVAIDGIEGKEPRFEWIRNAFEAE